jgi:hypothetical protein
MIIFTNKLTKLIMDNTGYAIAFSIGATVITVR